MVYICDECGSQFSKGWNLDRHKKNFHKLNFVCHLCGFKTNDKQTSIIHKKHHAEEYFECNHCNQKIKNKYNFARHLKEQHGRKNFSCEKCNYKTTTQHKLKKSPQKFYIAVKVNFFKRDKDGHKSEVSAFFHGSMHTMLRKEEFKEAFKISVQKIWKAFDTYIKNGSGWILEKVEKICLNTRDDFISNKLDI